MKYPSMILWDIGGAEDNGGTCPRFAASDS